MRSRVLLFVFFTVFLDMVGFGIVIPLLPFYVQSMGGTAEMVGILLGTFSLTQVVATPILGRLSDRFGRRPVILTSLLGNGLSMILFAFAAERSLLPWLFVSRILAGTTAGNLAACQAAVADVTDGSSRAAGMGRIGAGIGLGLVIGPILGSVLSPIHRIVPPLAAGSLAFLDLVGVALFMPETRGQSEAPTTAEIETDPRTLWETIADVRILSVMAMYFLTFLCMASVQVALPLLANARLGWSERQVGQVFGLYGLMALIVQGGLIGRLSRRFTSPRVLVMGACCVGLGMVAISGAHGAAALLVGVSLAGLGVGLTNPTLATLASQHAGRRRQGAVLGVAQSSGGAGRTVGPVWNGMLYARLGPSAPFVGAALAASLSLMVAVALQRRPAAPYDGGTVT
ncbi:MAG TPA: MFS transporter [Candidatus Binatia bacterium]|jgi:MFS family permease